MRLLSPDDACRSADVPIGRSARYDGRVIEVTDPAHISALRRVGYTAADAAHGPTRTGGYRCPDCGFAAFIKTCSRCGGVCERS